MFHRDRARHGEIRLLATLVGLWLAFLVGCGDERPVASVVDDPDAGTKGFIAGRALLAGDARRTNQIRIEVFVAEGGDKVDTTFPNDEGQFTTVGLPAGSYNVVASAPDIPGYGAAAVDNVPVTPPETTFIQSIIDVPDTSRAQILAVTPAPFAAIVPRRPTISGELRSAGSGLKRNTFFMRVNGEAVTSQVLLDISEDLRSGSFVYHPPVTFGPGEIEVTVKIANHAPLSTSERTWSFTILDGIARRVPSDEYPTITSALFQANDGDTILIAPGVYTVNDMFIGKEVVFLAEAMLEEGGRPEMTTFLPGPAGRHFRAEGHGGIDTMIKGFLLKDGRTPEGDGGASIVCRACDLTVDSCIFENNWAETGRGGAIAMGADASMTIRNCLFVDNLARRGGALVMFDGSDPVIEDCVFIGNRAVTAGDDGGLGGAIYLQSSSPVLRRNTFYGNLSGRKGGAIMGEAPPRVGPARIHSELNLYVENTAEQGTVHLEDFTTSLTSICDGFMPPAGEVARTGIGRSFQLTHVLDIPPTEDPGFCSESTRDLRLRPDSPFLREPCDAPGGLPVGCGGR